MAPAVRPADTRLKLLAIEDELFEQPFLFRFFQAVWLVEQLSEGKAPVGRFTHPEDEAVHFGVQNSLPFPASQIQSLERRKDQPPLMRVNFMGLTGPSGVLPLRYSELVADRVRSKDRALADFLDIFNHRMISFFYQAWEKYRFPLSYQREDLPRFSRYLSSLIGLGTDGLQERLAISDDSIRYYTGLFALQPRCAVALDDLLSDYFGVSCQVEQFVGSWYGLDSGDQCCFASDDGVSNQLGVGSVVGDAVWDQQARFRVRLGPLTREQYEDFLPTGSAYRPLEALIRFFVNNNMDFEVQLVLRREEVPLCELGAGEQQAPRLGWLTWMKTGPVFERDPADTILEFHEGA